MNANARVHTYWRVVTAAVVSLVLAVLTEEVLTSGPITILDADVARWLHHHTGRYRLVATLAESVTRIATPQWTIAASLVLAGAMSRYARSWNPFRRMLVAIVVLAVSVLGMKTVIGRPGPYKPAATGYFPSGHTTTAIVCAGTLLLLAHQQWPRLRSAHAVGVTATWGLLVGWAMTWRSYHWLSDVIAAWCLGTLILLALLRGHRQRSRGTTEQPGVNRAASSRAGDCFAAAPRREA